MPPEHLIKTSINNVGVRVPLIKVGRKRAPLTVLFLLTACFSFLSFFLVFFFFLGGGGGAIQCLAVIINKHTMYLMLVVADTVLYTLHNSHIQSQICVFSHLFATFQSVLIACGIV